MSAYKETEGRGNGLMKILLIHGVMLFSILIKAALFTLCFQHFYIRNQAMLPGTIVFPTACVSYVVLSMCFHRVYNGFLVGTYRVSELAYSQSLADFLSMVVLYVLYLLSGGLFYNPLPFVALFFVQAIWNIVWSLYANRLYLRMYPPMKTAILYRQERDLAKLQQVKHFSTEFDIQKYIRDPEDIMQLFKDLEGCSALFMIGIGVELRSIVAEYCLQNNVKAYLVPQTADVLLSGAKPMEAFNIPILRIYSPYPAPEYMIIKRGFDIIASFLGLVLASPIMIVTALAIKLYDGGPILYKQVRLTRNGAKFTMWKFRSMCVNAEKDGVARMACENDCRITPVGRIIRAGRIDELPQLFNILAGDMSVVGPRPERPEFSREYEQTTPAFSLRLQVKAGLTGYAQVYGRYNTKPMEKLQMDLIYINNMSIIEDLRLIFATLKILLIRESMVGVKQVQTSASEGRERV